MADHLNHKIYHPALVIGNARAYYRCVLRLYCPLAIEAKTRFQFIRLWVVVEESMGLCVFSRDDVDLVVMPDERRGSCVVVQNKTIHFDDATKGVNRFVRPLTRQGTGFQ